MYKVYVWFPFVSDRSNKYCTCLIKSSAAYMYLNLLKQVRYLLLLKESLFCSNPSKCVIPEISTANR